MSEAEWRPIYVPELDNVRAALDWALGGDGDPAVGIALAGASARVWTTLSLLGEGMQRLQAAVAHVANDTSDSDQARLFFWVSTLLGTAAPVKAVAAAERAADLYRRLGDATRLAHSLVQIGRMCVFMGRFGQAALVFEEAFPLLERTGQPRALASYYRESGALKMLTGDLVSARMHFEKAFTLFRDAGVESHALAMLLNLADMTWALGDLDGALVRFREAVTLMRKPPVFRDMLGTCLTNLAGVHTERGELAEALAAAREGLPSREEAGHAWVTSDHLALRAALAGKLANAARLAGFADSTYKAKETSRQPNEARAHARVQALLREKLHPDELERLLTEGARMSENEACRLALEE
jgi:tetratricopeptide (TPR) repeat protein